MILNQNLRRRGQKQRNATAKGSLEPRSCSQAAKHRRIANCPAQRPSLATRPNFYASSAQRRPFFQHHGHAHPRCQHPLRPDRPGHARLALRLDDPPFFMLTQPPPSTSPERQSRPSTPTHPSSRLSPPSTPRRTRLIRACSSLYDSTLPALTPTPRAVDDPGAYEPALPLHILTHIHHLQAGEIALATPAAALRLCLAYSCTCFPLPCMPSGLHFSPPRKMFRLEGFQHKNESKCGIFPLPAWAAPRFPDYRRRPRLGWTLRIASLLCGGQASMLRGETPRHNRSQSPSILKSAPVLN